MVRNSVLGRGVRVHCRRAGGRFDHLRQLRHRPPREVRRAILDKNVRVPKTPIGYDLEHDRRYHHVTESGIVVVEGNRSTVDVSTLFVSPVRYQSAKNPATEIPVLYSGMSNAGTSCSPLASYTKNFRVHGSTSQTCLTPQA